MKVQKSNIVQFDIVQFTYTILIHSLLTFQEKVEIQGRYLLGCIYQF